MRIVRFTTQGKIKYGVLEENIIRSLKDSPFTESKDLRTSLPFDGDRYELDKVKLLAPCMPTKIVALMFGYKSHIDEAREKPMGDLTRRGAPGGGPPGGGPPPIPDFPVAFLKPSTSVIGPGDDIIIPKDTSRRIDFEGEMAVIIGRTAKEITEDESKSYALGYTCINDISDRTAQQEDRMSNMRSKGHDTFAPMGPWIETDADPDNLLLETYLNGERLQHSSTSMLRFNVSTLISYISNIMTLLPGDVIATGTPHGCAPMKPGDVVELTIEKLGTLRNTVVSHA